MPMNYAGVRVQQTIRLPADLHRECVAQARLRKWSLNKYMCHALSEHADYPIPESVGMRQNQTIYDDLGNKIGTV